MKWINVNKKLPPDTESVLVMIGNGPARAVSYYYADKWFTGFYKEEELQNVTFWTKLKKPPTSHNSGYIVRIAKAILSQIAKATSYIRKRCVQVM